MKNAFVILCMFFATSAVSAQSFSGNTEVVKIKTSAICSMCKARIERDLTLSKGINKATLNLDDKVVTVAYNPDKTSKEDIKATISKIGYNADDVVADAKSHSKLPECCQGPGVKHK